MAVRDLKKLAPNRVEDFQRTAAIVVDVKEIYIIKLTTFEKKFPHVYSN